MIKLIPKIFLILMMIFISSSIFSLEKEVVKPIQIGEDIIIPEPTLIHFPDEIEINKPINISDNNKNSVQSQISMNAENISIGKMLTIATNNITFPKADNNKESLFSKLKSLTTKKKELIQNPEKTILASNDNKKTTLANSKKAKNIASLEKNTVITSANSNSIQSTKLPETSKDKNIKPKSFFTYFKTKKVNPPLNKDDEQNKKSNKTLTNHQKSQNITSLEQNIVSPVKTPIVNSPTLFAKLKALTNIKKKDQTEKNHDNYKKSTIPNIQEQPQHIASLEQNIINSLEKSYNKQTASNKLPTTTEASTTINYKNKITLALSNIYKKTTTVTTPKPTTQTATATKKIRHNPVSIKKSTIPPTKNTAIAKNKTISMPKNVITSNEIILKPKALTDIKIKGKMDVSLHDGYKEPKVIIKGNPKDIAYVEHTIKNGSLNIVLGKGYPHFSNVHIEIRTKAINSFEYHGDGTIIGKHLHSNLMSLIIENDGKTTLGEYLPIRNFEISGKGYVDIKGIQSPGINMKLSGSPRIHLSGKSNLTNLTLNGNSWLSLYWVDSKDLHIWGRDNSFLQLAGIVEHLHVDLCQKAHFDGKHLRAKSSFIKTHDTSLAEISSTIKQHTLAADNSNIYFYELPNMKADFMIMNGSVLDMRNINDPEFEEPTRYNKPPYN